MIEAKSIIKRFDGFCALDNLTLKVQKGSVYGLIGPNGAGKTTFIKTLMGVYRADSGILTVDGEPSYENLGVKRRMLYISDDLFFYPTYTVKDVSELYAGLYPNWSWETFDKLKVIFKIDVKKKVRRLSKGMQKQVAFWVGIASHPEIMILDEPVDGLDPVMRRNTWKILLQSVAEDGLTVLISSHNLRELEDVCDHVGVLYKGKVVLEKALDDVKGNLHKVQCAFAGDIPEALSSKLTILHQDRYGSVLNWIVRGKSDDIVETINAYAPLVLDILPLTLEEVFIFELGGLGYEFENFLM